MDAKITHRKGMHTAHDFLTKEWLQKVETPLFVEAGLNVEMLRLDRIHPYISGNKWMKLHYWLDTYKKGDYKGIITFGGPWSNHLHACAYACFKENIPMHAIIKGYTGLKNQMIADMEHWGCKVSFTNRQAFYNEAIWKEKAAYEQWLRVPMGGDGPEGEKGVTEWFNQLPLPQYDNIFCSVGTGTTLAGIAKSKLSFNQLIGIDPGTGDHKIADRVAGLNSESSVDKVYLHTTGAKFGKLTPPLADFMQKWHQQTGISLDFIYTGPMCQYFVKLIETRQLSAGKRVLLIHTGGLQGNRSHQHLPI